MGIKDTEQDRTMIDGPERRSHTGRVGGAQKIEIYVGRKEEVEKEG